MSTRRRRLTPEQELENAFSEALLRELASTHTAWRTANAGKCRVGEVAQALVYFVGGSLAEMGVAARLPQEGQWESFVRDSTQLLGEAMGYCRSQIEAQR